MIRSDPGRCLLVGALLAAVSLPAAAVNLLANPTFESGLGGWNVSNQPLYSVAWNSLDANASPSSGSARMTNNWEDGVLSATLLGQCVPVAAGVGYRLSLKGLIPPGQSRSGEVGAYLYWYADAGCDTGPLGPAAIDLAIPTVGVWVEDGDAAVAPAGAAGAYVGLTLFKSAGGGSLVAHVDDVSLAPEGVSTCTPSDTVLCLDAAPGDRRFQVRMQYATVQGGGFSGDGRAVPLGSLGVANGGLFWFFSANNPEMLIKVLDGCTVNGHFWVYYSAGTNVGFTVEVLDTQTGRVFVRSNPDTVPAPPVQEVEALDCT